MTVTVSDVCHVVPARSLTISVSADRFAGRRICSIQTLVKRYVRRGEFLRTVNLFLQVRPNWKGTRIRSMLSDTNIRDVTTTNRYVRRSSEKVSYKTKAIEVPAKICGKKNQVSRAQVFVTKKEGNEIRSLKKESSLFATRVRARACMYVGKLKRRSKVSVPKGSGGRSDGRTVIVVVEQRGITWGYMTWGPGPGGPRVAKAKVCRVYKARNRRQSASSSLLDAPGTSREQK